MIQKMKKILIILGLVFVTFGIYAMSINGSMDAQKTKTYEIRGNNELLHLYDGEIVTVSMTGSRNCDLIFKHNDLSTDIAKYHGCGGFVNRVMYFSFYVNNKKITIEFYDGPDGFCSSSFDRLPKQLRIGGNCVLTEI